MKKIVFAIAALLFAGAVSAQELTDIQTKFQDAATAAGAKDYAKAAILFGQVIDEGLDVEGAEAFVSGAQKSLPDVIFRQGVAAAQAGNLDGALDLFTRSAESAELYGNMTVLNNARSYIGRVVLMQGANAFNSKDYATAAAIFQKGYDGNPNDMTVALNLAMSYSEMGELEKGNQIYKNIIALEGVNSRFADAVATAKEKLTYYNLYLASQDAQAGKYAEAIAATENVLAVLPVSPEATMTRLQAYNSMKDYNKVIELGDATAATQTAEDQRSTVNYMVGAAYSNLENYPRAMDYYRKVVAGPYAAAARTQITELQKIVK